MKNRILSLIAIVLSLSVFGQTNASAPKKTNTEESKNTSVSPKKTTKKSTSSNKITPTKYVAKVAIMSKKTNIYYALSVKEDTEIKVNGPGDIEILLRVRLKDIHQKSKPYYINYVIDGKQTKTIKVESQKASKKTVYKTNLEGVPSEAATIKIDVSPGNHTISFHKADTDQKVHARFMYTKKTEPKWKEYHPVAKLDTVRIKYLDQAGLVKKYYRISSSNKFTINSKDTLYLKILVKAELDNTVQSNTFLNMIIEEKNEIIKTYRITGKKSTKTEYVDEKKLIPGNTNVIYYKIPPGQHTYNLYLQEKNKTALIQVYYNSKPVKKNI